MNKIFKISIYAHGCESLEVHVVARSKKQALMAALENLPETFHLWQAPGWQSVQVSEASQAFVL